MALLTCWPGRFVNRRHHPLSCFIALTAFLLWTTSLCYVQFWFWFTLDRHFIFLLCGWRAVVATFLLLLHLQRRSGALPGRLTLRSSRWRGLAL